MVHFAYKNQIYLKVDVDIAICISKLGHGHDEDLGGKVM